MVLAIVLIASLAATSVKSCSIYCPDDTSICVNEIWYTSLGASCGGFLGCVNQTTPCNGECSSNNPVISPDGQTCSPCAYDNQTIQIDCRDCQTGHKRTGRQDEEYEEKVPEEYYWCVEEEQCKLKSTTCNNRCPLPSYPDKDGDYCKRCRFGNLWCFEESRCYDPENEPCNQECYPGSYKMYCSATNSCLEIWESCENLGITKVRVNSMASP